MPVVTSSVPSFLINQIKCRSGESRMLLIKGEQLRRLAQLRLAHSAVNRRVVGSNPT